MTKYLKLIFLILALPLNAEPILLDGELSESDWESGFVITDYYETVPYTLNKAKVKTKTIIFSNEDGIYVGFTNYQENSSMLSNKSLRDEMWVNADQN